MLGTGIKRVQAAVVVLMVAILGFLGSQSALATETDPSPGAEQPVTPGEEPTSPGPENPQPPIVVPPILPAPDPEPLDPEPAPTSVPSSEAPAPAPVVPSVQEPLSPPLVPSDAPVVQPVPMPAIPAQNVVEPGYVIEPETPVENATVAPTEPTPSPTSTKTAAPPVVSAEIAGPLKVALAPVAESNPIVQGLTVLVLILLGLAYFRALRSKGIRGPRLNGK